MKAGDVLASGWRVDDALPRAPETERWSVTSTSDEGQAELVTPAGTEGWATFERLQRQMLDGPADPALVRPFAVIALPDGRPAALRPPVVGLGPERAISRLPVDRIAALGARLLPAVLVSGGATYGALTPHDVAIGLDGRVVLAPLGRPRARLQPDDAKRAAPETFRGAEPDAAAGLYGLGVLLYEWLGGRLPVGAHPPPPSTLRHDVPPALDAAVALLLEPDPVRRVGALPLLRQVSGPAPDLRPLPPPSARQRVDGGEVRVTVSGPPPLSDPVGLLVPPESLATLDPAGKSLLAGLLRLPASSIDHLTREGHGALLATFKNRRSATAAATRLGELGAHTRVVGGGDGCLFGWIALVVVLGPLLLLGVGLASAVTGTLPVAAIVGLVLALIVMIGLGLGVRRRSRGRADLAFARDAVRRERSAWSDPGLEQALDDLAQIRKAIATRDLPGSAASDLRAGLRAMEDRLSTARELGERCDRAMGGVDLPALQTRLAALANTQDHGERDRVARTVADFEELRRKRAEIDETVQRVRAAAAEVTACLGAYGDGVDDDRDLEALLRAARALPAPESDRPDGPKLTREPAPSTTHRAPAHAGRKTSE